MHTHLCEQEVPPFILEGRNGLGQPVLLAANHGMTNKDFVVGYNGVPVARFTLLAIATGGLENVTQTVGSWLAN